MLLLKRILGITTALLSLMACSTSTQQHLDNVRNQADDRITVGKVQRTIRMGMTNAEVVESLGSPNMVSTDEKRQEVWVYDKISTETVRSTSSAGGGIGALFLGIPSGNFGVGGQAGLQGSRSAGAMATSQRTLTVIVKFNKAGRVHDIAYHASQF